MSLMFKTIATIDILSSPNVFWGEARQVAHFPSPPGGLAQKTLHPSRTV